MKHDTRYKNYRIRAESFQPTPSSGWIPRFVVQCADASDNTAPSSHDRLDQCFGSATEADLFAVQEAKDWIDRD